MSDVEKAHVKLTNVDRGYAEVELWQGDRLVIRLGYVQRVSWTGTVSRADLTKWLAYRIGGDREGIHFATRRAAVDALKQSFTRRLGKKLRRAYRLTLAEDG